MGNLLLLLIGCWGWLWFQMKKCAYSPIYFRVGSYSPSGWLIIGNQISINWFHIHYPLAHSLIFLFPMKLLLSIINSPFLKYIPIIDTVYPFSSGLLLTFNSLLIQTTALCKIFIFRLTSRLILLLDQLHRS